MRTLVYESTTSGHYLNFAAQVALALANAGADSHLAVARDAPGEFGFEHYVAPLLDRVTVHATVDAPTAGSPLRVASKKIVELRATVNELRPERLYLPTADGFLQLLGLAKLFFLPGISKTVKVEGLLLNGSVAYPHLSSRREKLTRRINHHLAVAGCDALHHLNPFVWEWEIERGSEHSSIFTMPDPVERLEISKNEAREQLNIPQNIRLFGMVGRLDRRKGADVLIEAFCKADLEPSDRLLLWGPCSPDIEPHLKMLESRGLRDRVFLKNGPISNDHLLKVISAMDLLVLPYRVLINSSSIVIRAAAAGRPVLTTGGGWAEQVTRRFALGWTFDTPDSDLLAHALPQALTNAISWQPSPASRGFVEYNSPQNFAAHWVQGYKKAMGLGPSPEMITWPSIA